MSKYDYAKRLKKLMVEDMKTTQRETQLAKTKSKYNENSMKLEVKIRQQSDELQTLQIEFKKHAKVRNYLAQQKEQLQQRLLKLREDFATDKTEQITKQQHIQKDMEKLRCLITCTSKYVNLTKLPERIQGISIAEKENSSRLIPFNINPLQHTQQEVKNMLWQSAQSTVAYTAEWQHLIMGCFVNDIDGNIIEKR